jgi:hypothetical protein
MLDKSMPLGVLMADVLEFTISEQKINQHLCVSIPA